MTLYRKGDQVAYIPPHADGDINHPDVEFGFVTSTANKGAVVFCRFFYNKGRHRGELRTTANSESVWKEMLVKHKHKEKHVIKELLEQIEASNGSGL